MTDNRTTELLCKLLEEHGIEWKDGDAAYEIEWSTPDGRHCSAMYWKPTFTVLISRCTPEQAIAATLGNESATHGKLTAEQVRECAERVYLEGYSDGSVNRGAHIEETDWQAIADELNAELGSGTCEVECFDDGVDEGIDGEWFNYAPPRWHLSCGHVVQGLERPSFCSTCGKVVKQ